MKSENRIYLKGIIGKDARIIKFGERSVANFSMATEYDYKQNNGGWEKETTWHNITAWQGFGICGFDFLKKGTQVYVVGRLRSRKYTDPSGVEKFSYEVLAETIDIVTQENTSKTTAKPQGNINPQPSEDDF